MTTYKLHINLDVVSSSILKKLEHNVKSNDGVLIFQYTIQYSYNYNTLQLTRI